MNMELLKKQLRDDLDKAERKRHGLLRTKAAGMLRPGELDFSEGEIRTYRYVISLLSCHGCSDGDCYWELCPQLRDNEPKTSGRHCPLDTRDEE